MHGIDFGQESIDYASQVAESLDLDNSAKFECKDILSSDLEDEKYEFALCSAVLHHLETKEDMVKGLKEISRVLKPGSGSLTGSGAISIHVKKFCVEILSDLSTRYIENILIPLNLTREKMTHITDALTATYIQTTLKNM